MNGMREGEEWNSEENSGLTEGHELTCLCREPLELRHSFLGTLRWFGRGDLGARLCT